MTTDEPQSLGSQSAGRILVAVFAMVVLGVVGYFALGMPGMDMSSTKTRPHRMSAMRRNAAPFRMLEVDAFAREMRRPGSFVVNVHTPDEGGFAGTAAFIAFDHITGDARLPANKRSRILLYCRTGRMSAIAAASLAVNGYTNVADLNGGMVARKAAGRSIVARR